MESEKPTVIGCCDNCYRPVYAGTTHYYVTLGHAQYLLCDCCAARVEARTEPDGTRKED